MITVTKRIYKIDQGEYYEVGSKVDFGKEENNRIVKLGFAENVKRTRKTKK